MPTVYQDFQSSGDDTRASDPPVMADREWFLANPRRNHRIRPVLPIDQAAIQNATAMGWRTGTVEGATRYVLVKQHQPGVRSRHFFFMRGEPKQSEAECKRLFALVMDQTDLTGGGILVNVNEVIRWCQKCGIPIQPHTSLDLALCGRLRGFRSVNVRLSYMVRLDLPVSW